MSPDFVRNDIVFTVAHRFVSVDGNISRDRLNDTSQRLPDVRITAGLDRRRIHFIEEAVSLRLYDDFSLMRGRSCGLSRKLTQSGVRKMKARMSVTMTS